MGIIIPDPASPSGAAVGYAVLTVADSTPDSSGTDYPYVLIASGRGITAGGADPATWDLKPQIWFSQREV